MRTSEKTSKRSGFCTRFLGTAVVLAGLGVSVHTAIAEEDWPPAPWLEVKLAAEDAAPLPASITAEALEQGRWRCTFRFRPKLEAERVVLTGSFADWEREAHPMQGPDVSGEWTTRIDLDTGVYQYKFLVDNDQWFSDPLNPDRVPDSYGHFNSIVRLGRLAHMRQSEEQTGDGRIGALALAHQSPRPLYIQPVGTDEVSIRYRTFAHDVQSIWLALKDGTLTEMSVASEGPLFAYWEARIAAPARADSRTPKLRGLDYTFVLDDGAGRVGDPYLYHFTLPPTGSVETPAWAKHAVWYQIMIDRFRNGTAANDPDPVRPWTSEWFTASEWEGKDGQTFYENFVFDRIYGGDLDGLAEQLPYLKELGVNALYLTPVFKAPSYHKYDVQNYLHIDDGFGTRGDYEKVAAQEDLLDPSTWQWTETDRRFLAFLKQAHELGFKVILDGVFNHVGVEHPAFQDVLKHGKRSRYADWFEVTSWEPFAYKGWAGFAHMPVFKKNTHGFASPGVKQHLFAVTRRWMDPNGDGDPRDGIDGWRLDVPDKVPRPFWAEWRRLVKSTNPDALITGELWNRADEWLYGRHFDGVINYPFAKTVAGWVFDREQKLTVGEAVSRFAELRLAYPAAATYVLQNLIDSHDTDRLASMPHNPDREYDRQNRVQDNNPDYDNSKPAPEAYARARLAVLLQMTYIGAPLIYYGDEVGMWGADDPSNRKPMLWKDLEPYDEPAENAVLEDQLAFYKQALALRNDHPALRIGSFTNLLADDAADVWAFLRSAESEHVLVVLNASGTPREVDVPLPDGAPLAWTTIFGKDSSESVSEGKLTVTVPPIAGVVLHAEGK
ncbi:MAG: alpha-glucosidase C-terminal domain-containing protein [Phycisphaerae bacterium]|nr:alpha-glucosidase C-terminal domain-containing protein [Phycisphaerae bacterium]